MLKLQNCCSPSIFDANFVLLESHPALSGGSSIRAAELQHPLKLFFKLVFFVLNFICLLFDSRSSMTYENANESNKKLKKRHKMNPNEERHRSELQNNLPIPRNPFSQQKIRSEKATHFSFNLDGLWAESQHSSGWHGAK
ncbi:hypothetical protein AVEN_251760-1 [Araneus ventricosus]|uniref:Uncharacterized protein n=1 Tax=Araneus ventricosus TaxID=182803 RepID=A0A4Y2ME18_ARAVE|nr:hypothetical protein AVEN_251760-1 [Araneus ventricosus]